MPAPTLVTVYPADGDVGIPIGSQLHLDFSEGIDITSVRDFIVLYGNDFDMTSGPDSVMWIDQDTGANPFFLRSPGFKGTAEIDAHIVYYDLDTGLDIDTPAITTSADEASTGVAGVGHRVYITPKTGALSANTEYTLYIIGDPTVQGTGVASRSVFDVVPDGGNTSTDGVIIVSGGYTGIIDDQLIITITTAGDIGTAKYSWYFASEGSGAARRDTLSNRRYRTLDLGLQIRFTGSNFALGDQFTVNLEVPSRLATNTKVVFTTNDGTYSVAPDSPSTPATSEPPSTIIPPVPGATTTSTSLQVIEMTPADGAFNVSKNTRMIVIEFSDQLQSSTITSDTVQLFKLPALGWFQGERQPVALQTRLTVDGNLLTIEF